MELLVHTVASLLRVTAATVISVPLAVVLGILSSSSRKAELFIKLFLPIPKIALLPLVMLILGVGEASKLVFLLLFTVFPLADTCKTAFLNTDRETEFLYRKAGMSGSKVFKEVTFQKSLPAIITAAGNTASNAFAVLMLAENYGTDKGLGFYILDSFFKMKYPDMVSAILFSAVLGCLFPITSKAIASVLCPWSKNNRISFCFSGKLILKPKFKENKK